jgi:DNA/RNA endonuclease G (NUC1)
MSDEFKTNYDITIQHDYVKIKSCLVNGTEKGEVSIPTGLLKTIVDHLKVSGMLDSKTEEHYLKNHDFVKYVIIHNWNVGELYFEKKYKITTDKYNRTILEDITPKVK